MPEPTTAQKIRLLLDQERPDRYQSDDKSWMEPVIDVVAMEMSSAEARTIAARQMVGRVEGDATKSANRFFREVAASGELPLDWFETLSWPVAINGVERVALRAITPSDLKEFATVERRSASLDFTSRNQACEGALIVASLMPADGVGLTCITSELVS